MADKHATTVTPSPRPADAEMERRPVLDRETLPNADLDDGSLAYS